MMYDHDRVITTAATRRLGRLAGLALAIVLAVSPGLAGDKGPGYVDPNRFIRAAGDDMVTVQVSIGEAMLGILTRNPDLKEIAGGLKSIEAVVLDLSGRDVAESVGEIVLDTESRLLKEGWERIVLVRDEDGVVRILVLPQDDKIQGLVVLILDHSDNTMVFANMAGTVDLAAIEELGEAFGVPGLDDIDTD